MNGLIIKVLSISIAVVTVVYLIIYKGNTMITKIFSVCIIAAMVIYWIVYERNTRKRKKQELQRDDYLFAKESDLPLQINWNEINDFLSDSGYGVNMPMENWFMMDWAIQPCVENGIKEGKFSMKGFRVLQALSNDMKHIFYDVRFNYDRGPDIEDKNRKYEAVKRCWIQNTPVCQKKYGRIYMTNLLRYMKEKSNYNTKEKAVEFLGNETNFTYEECSKANDFHIRLNKKN